MRRILVFFLFPALLATFAQGQLKTRTDQTQQQSEDEPVAGAKANNDPLYVQLRHITVQSEAIPVKDFTLKRDTGTFIFKTGAFHLLAPVNGKITGAVFTGEATFSLKPPIEVERRYLSIVPLQTQAPFSLAPEEVALTLWDPGHEGIWASFHYAVEYSAGKANSDEQNQTFAIQHQKLDTAIDKRAYLTGNAQTTVVALQNGVRVLSFSLFPTLRVQSVIGEDHQQLSFIQEPKLEDADFAVILPKPLRLGEKYTITTKYKGKDAISDEGGGNYFPNPEARENWYQSQDFGQYD